MGLCEAVKSAVNDLLGKGAQILLADFCKENLRKTNSAKAKKFAQQADWEQGFVNDAIRKGLNAGDAVSE